MEKEFVNYEIALALKELGFDEKCFGWYNWTGKDLSLTNNSYVDINPTPAPLYQQCWRWFREKKLHNTFPSVIQTRSWATLYRIVEWHPSNDSTSISESGYYDTYEEAELACLIKLIEIIKQKS